jgi:hypothetical protein
MHLEAIKSEQKEIFKKLRYFKEYYLAGGTALALQIGHRISVDFDFFYDKKIPQSLLGKIRRIFKEYKIKTEVNNPEQLTVSLTGVTLTFVKYPFPLIFKLNEYQGVKLLSVPEIAVTKAFTIGHRATLKDYVDLYFILEERHCSLEEIIKISKKKFKDEFNQRLFLEQLIYLEDVEDMEIEYLKEQPTKVQIRDLFEKEVKGLKI